MTAVATQAAASSGLFGRLVRAEIAKMRTTRTWWALLLGMIAPVVLFSVVTALVDQGNAGQNAGGRAGDILGAAGFAKIFVAVLGILAFTTEFRHNTATSTFLAASDRTKVMLAKLVTGFLVGMAYAVVALLVTGVGLLVYASRGREVGLDGEVLKIALWTVLTQALYGTLGVGIGSVIRNQVGAIVGSVAYLFIFDGLIVSILIATHHPKIATLVLGGAETSIVRGDSIRQGDDVAQLLSRPIALVIFLAYITVFAVIGTLLIRKRDV